MEIRIERTTTVPQALEMLVEHGPQALLAADGLGRLARHLLELPYTIYADDRHLYGDAATWAAWDDLRARHGEELRRLATEHATQSAAENAARIERAFGGASDAFCRRCGGPLAIRGAGEHCGSCDE